jgi:hypothetical protein
VSLRGCLACITRKTPPSSVQPIDPRALLDPPGVGAAAQRGDRGGVRDTAEDLDTGDAACEKACLSPPATLPMIAQTYLVPGEDWSLETTAFARAGVPMSLDCTSLPVTMQPGQWALTVAWKESAPTWRVGTAG